MRHLIVLLLISVSCFGQKAVNTTLSNTARTVNYTEMERAKIEGLDLETSGLLYPSTYPFNTTSTVANQGALPGSVASPITTIGGFGAPITKIYYIDHYAVSTSQPVFARVSLGRANTGDKMIYSGSGVYPANARIYGGDGSATLQLYGRLGTTDTTKRVVVSLSVHGYVMSADQDYDAPYFINIYGDSNTEGTQIQNVTSRWDAWHWKLKAWYQNTKSISIHLVDKSQSGAQSTLFDKVRGGGRLSGVKTPALGFWVLGTNDTDTTAYRANLKRFLADWQIENPNTPIIICGPAPRSAGSTGETTAGYIREIDRQVVIQHNRPTKVFFLSLGISSTNPTGAFPNNVETYFTTTDASTSGNRVHWNTLGQQKVFEAIRDFIIDKNITLNYLSFWQLLILLNVLVGYLYCHRLTTVKRRYHEAH